jgi:methionine sulfoxide reductase heme-binding subunit
MPGRRSLHALLIATALIPAAILVWRYATDGLGANPIEEITHETGKRALQLLLASLAVTPLRRGLGWSGLAPYRRTLGLLAFSYACLHLATYVVLDLFFDWDAILEDIAKRRYVIAGASAFCALVPLAITSTRGWIRRLGRRWVTLHRLVYVAAMAAVIHFIWLVKADLREPLAYAAALALLLGARLWWRLATAAPALTSRRHPDPGR